MVSPPPDHPICPRCGYDVTGTMSLWTESCPLEGRCTECGYDFQWADVLSPMRRVPAWFFETARKGLVRSAISTSVRTLAPWWFWSTVRMRYPLQPRRLLIQACAAFLVAYIAGVAGVGLPMSIEVFRFARGYQGWLEDWTDYYLTPSLSWLAGIDPSSPLRDSSLAPSLGSIASRLAILSAILIPAGFLLVPATRRAAKVRMRHVIRAGVYGWIGVCVLIALWWSSIAVLDIAVDNGLFHPDFPNPIIATTAFVWTIYVLVFWVCVCRQYLCIKSPMRSALLLCIMAMLLSVVGLGVFLAVLGASAW